MRFALAAVSAAALATLFGCSDPVPQSADGAFFLATIQDDPLKCMISGHTAQVGLVDAEHLSTAITDGTDKTAVSCTISTASPFAVHGLINDTLGKTGNYFEMEIPSLTTSATEASPAVGTGVFSAPWTAGEPYSGACNYWLAPMSNETVDVKGGTGRVWVSFSCAALVDQQSTCPLKQGFAAFENCLVQDASTM